jgi:hypothetical protein
MTDWVHYAILFGIIGRVANTFVVHRQLEEIFRFRRQSVEKRFGCWLP